MIRTYVISALCAGAVFLVLLLGFHWGYLMCVVIAVALFYALSLLLKPRRKIGGVDVENLENGNELEETFQDAREDLRTIQTAGAHAQSAKIRKGAEGLVKTGGSIISYLEQHVDQIPDARRFLNYYLDTAADLMQKYTDFLKNDAPQEETRAVTKQTESAILMLNDAFQNQYSRLLRGQVMDIEVDVDVLQSMSQTDQKGSPFRKAGAEQGGTNP